MLATLGQMLFEAIFVAAVGSYVLAVIVRMWADEKRVTVYIREKSARY